ncbi:MAG TPA: hypothetical protein VMC79_15035 [Rectinemataceae bacterium]|nr:hypothetical protein [Rectinemataceae bacterium]
MRYPLAAFGILIFFGSLISCNNPAGNHPKDNYVGYISFSLNGSAQTKYSKGVASTLDPIIEVSTTGVPLCSIPQDSDPPLLVLYASKDDADFASSSGTDYIYIHLVTAAQTASEPAGDYLDSTNTGAAIDLNTGTSTYSAAGVNHSQIDLHIAQTITDSSSGGKTIKGTFTGTITDGSSSPTIDGSFSLVYQTSSLVIP